MKEDKPVIINIDTAISRNANILLDFELNPVIEESKYSMIKQDTTLNALARVSNKTGIEKRDFTTTGVIRTQNGSTDLNVIIEEYANVSLKPSTSKLLRIITMEFTKDENNKCIQIPLKEYMELTGLKDVKEARKKVKKDLEALYNISCEAHIENRKGDKDYIKFRICDTQGIKNGIIIMNLSDSIAMHLRKCELMPYPKELLKIESNSNKNPYAFYLGDKITELKKYNQYDKAKKGVKESFNVSVRTLLDVCLRNGLPSYETVQTTDRRVDERIIKPFERDLEACSNNIFEWEYCNEKGTPLTEEQLSPETKSGKYKALTYKEWIDLYIKITFFKDYPTAPINVKKVKASEKKAKKKDSK